MSEIKWRPYPQIEPPKRKRILVTIQSDDNELLSILTRYNGDNRFDRVFEDEKVMAWMPMPEPYKAPKETTPTGSTAAAVMNHFERVE